MQLALKEWWTSGKEIEKRFIINPDKWLILPDNYLIYHQAEIGSGKAEKIIPIFREKTLSILSDYRDTCRSLEEALCQIKAVQSVKIRTRRILDPKNKSLRAELTLKFKTKNPEFKIYDEYNLGIDPELSLRLIEHIAPGHQNDEWDTEYGVRKHRYNILGPDGKIWDLDKLQWLNKWLYIWEIELPSTDTPLILPHWAIHQVNGDNKLKFLGTKELQETPWEHLSQKEKNEYLKYFQKRSWLKKVIGL